MLITPDSILKLITAEIKKQQYGDLPANLYEPISYIMDLGGKRLRPVLAAYVYSLFKDNVKEVAKSFVAIEVFHNFTLMHDDIMDNAPLRRGKSTVHEKWNSNIAILSGDAMLVKAYQLLEGLDTKSFDKIFPAFNQCALGVCEGQQLDMDFSTRNDVTIPEYIEMIRLKTAVLLGFSAEMGAVLAEANDKDVQALKSFGEHIGIAFQIKDDLLDVYGDAAKFGKQVGGDILEKKKTFLYLKAFENASKAEKEKLHKLFDDAKLSDDAKVKQVKAMYDKLNIKEAAEQEMNHYYEQALSALARVKTDIFRKGLLKSFINNLMQREN